MDQLELRVKSVTYEAQRINSLELVPLSDVELPSFTAGAHIDLHLPNGLRRSYSLVNPQRDRRRYVVAVANDLASRGGSRFIHEELRAGDVITTSLPRNNFELNEDAPHSVLIAGGIGVTPLYCMIQRLEDLERSWELHYSVRTRASCAFLAELQALEKIQPARVKINFSREPGAKVTDFAGLIQNLSANTHIYCCGPKTMLTAFEAASALRPPANIHVEYFSAKNEPAKKGGYTVVLARSGQSFEIPPSKSILEVLLDAGLDVPFSCMQGVCGSCEVEVLDGEPDHRDSVLTASERSAGKGILICCSGSKSKSLVLNL
jgi:ferredoxin-NADP reductase